MSVNVNLTSHTVGRWLAAAEEICENIAVIGCYQIKKYINPWGQDLPLSPRVVGVFFLVYKQTKSGAKTPLLIINYIIKITFCREFRC